MDKPLLENGGTAGEPDRYPGGKEGDDVSSMCRENEPIILSESSSLPRCSAPLLAVQPSVLQLSRLHIVP